MSSSQCWLLAFLVVAVVLHLLVDSVQANKSNYTSSNQSGVPFKISLNEVRIGHVLVIGGKSIAHASGLNMSFYGENKQDVICSIYLHWGATNSTNEIVMNTRQFKRGWGSETRASLVDKEGDVILKPGNPFKIRVFVLAKGLQVKVNEVDVIFYPHRMPFSKIRSFGIPYRNGLEQITQFDHRAIHPMAIPIVQPPLCRFNYCISEFSNDIPRRFVAGDLMIVTAIPYGSENGQFLIEFTEADTRRQALHFNARFSPDFVVVRNAMNDNLAFGVEERDGVFPFVLGRQFRLAIAIEEDKFRFAVDGRSFGIFKYRSENQLATLNGIKVASKGDLRLIVTGLEHRDSNNTECM